MPAPPDQPSGSVIKPTSFTLRTLFAQLTLIAMCLGCARLITMQTAWSDGRWLLLWWAGLVCSMWISLGGFCGSFRSGFFLAAFFLLAFLGLFCAGVIYDWFNAPRIAFDTLPGFCVKCRDL